MLDVVLEVCSQRYKSVSNGRFNPYCAGCSFGRPELYLNEGLPCLVSILIVLDVVLEDLWIN